MVILLEIARFVDHTLAPKPLLQNIFLRGGHHKPHLTGHAPGKLIITSNRDSEATARII